MEKLKKLLYLSSQKSESAELFYMKQFIDNIIFDANELQSIQGTETEGIGLRVKKNGRIGFSTSTKFCEDIIGNAIECAEFGNISNITFADRNINFSRDEYLDETLDELHKDYLINKGENIIKQIRKFDKRINVNVSFSKTLEDVHLLTSSGFDGNYKKNRFCMGINMSLTRENDIFLIDPGWLDMDKMEKESELIEEFISDISHGMNIVRIDSGRYPVLLSPHALSSFVWIFLEGVRGHNIFRKTSPLHSRLGEQIFDERISIYDDGAIPGGFNSRPFDDEGTESQKTILVENGILRNFLLDRSHAGKLNRLPTGNAFRNTVRLAAALKRGHYGYPMIAFSNIILKPGGTPGSQLLEDIKRGLFIKDISGITMGDIQSGDFTGTMSVGYKVEDGKIIGRLKNTAITGNIYTLFKEHLLGITSEHMDYFGVFNLPSMLFRDVEVTAR